MMSQLLVTLGMVGYGAAHALLHPFLSENLLAETVSTAGVVEQLPPRHFKDLESRRTRIKYGPFTVPSSADRNGMKTFRNRNMTLPCQNCTVISLQAGLEYANGSYANADTGMWLHHAILVNMVRNETSCPSLPEISFASGNERTLLDFSVNGTRKSGYYISDDDHFAFSTDLMNEIPESRDAVLTLEWEIVPGLPEGFEVAIPIWLDIDGACLPHDAEVSVPNNTQTFSFVMDPPWTANFPAKTLVMAGHLHDGGENLVIMKNGQPYCNSVAKYGESAGYISGTPGMPGMNMDGSMPRATSTSHISSMSGCSAEESIKPGDRWSVRANYNLTEHAPMMEQEKIPAPIMGIGFMYIAKV